MYQNIEGLSLYCSKHRVRVPECLSLCRKWVPPSPPLRASLPPFVQRGGSSTRFRGEGVEVPDSDDWTKSLALYLLLYQKKIFTGKILEKTVSKR
jgi:hypothetical protein